jgi:small subunit ribosomal protein S17
VPAQAAEEPAPTEAEETEAPDAGVATPAATDAAASRAPSVADAKRQKKRLARALRERRARARAETPGERRPIVRVPKPETERGRRQERRGVVVSDAMDKTIVVKVDVTKVHQRYKKVIRRSAKFHAHDERNLAKIGDVVRIVETRPLSATKRWRLAEILEEAK